MCLIIQGVWIYFAEVLHMSSHVTGMHTYILLLAESQDYRNGLNSMDLKKIPQRNRWNNTLGIRNKKQ